MKDNFLNINEKDKTKYIYRIMSFERLAEMLITGMMTLVKPFRWEDPFENFILQHFEKSYQKKEFDFKFRNSLYGSCWTLQSRSDALWRIYSPDKMGVCVRTNVEDLFNSLYDQGGKLKNISCFIGKVIYLPQGEIYKKLNHFKEQFDKVPKGSGLADTLLFKRTAFQHESEIRLIYHDPIPNDDNEHKFEFECYPYSIFDQVTFDPRMGINTYKALSTHLIEKLEFKGIIRQSTLYKIPKKFQ